MYRFLRKDIRGLDAKLGEVGDELRRVNADAADWTRQSSETWHDNFGFEEGERQKRALMIRMDEIRALLKKAEVVQKPDGSTVEIGTIVTFVEEDGNERRFTVSSYMVLQKVLDNEISYEAPLMKPLIAHRVGDDVEILIRGQSQTIEIKMIEVAEALFVGLVSD